MTLCLPIECEQQIHQAPCSPAQWRTPSLRLTDLFPEPAEDPSVSATTCQIPKLISMPVEILEEIATACLRFKSRTARSTLSSLALTNSRLARPAQKALLRSLSISSSTSMRSLAKALKADPGLGRSCRSFELRIAPPVIYIANSRKATAIDCQEAQKQALASLLPFLPRIKQIKLNCNYDLPESFLSLFTQHCKLVTRCSISSSAGYTKLVYVSPKATCMLLSWVGLTDLSMTMPLISSTDPELFDTALMQSIESQQFSPNGLKSLHISGFRGQASNLRSLIAIAGSYESLERFSFVCPLDEDIGECLSTAIAPGQLKHLCLWSWSASYRPQLLHLLRCSSTLSKLQSIACSANDLTEELIFALPSTLTRILICTHTAYSPLRIEETVQALLERGRNSGLKEVVLYDPGADSDEGAGIAWEPLMRSSIKVTISSTTDILYQ